MRKKYITLAVVAFAVLLGIAAATAFAVDRNSDAVETARADVTVLSQGDIQARPAGTAARTVQDFRDSAALLLVGSMLLGLAAAVRRTA